MKKLVLIFAVVFSVISFLCIGKSYGQDQHSVGVAPEATSPTSNAIFLELGGNGLLYTLNYDRLLGQDYGIRVGIGYIGVSASSPNDGSGTGGTTASASVLIIPATFNYFFASHSGGKVSSSKFEVGAGIVFVDLSASVSGGVGNAFSGSGSAVGGTATIGYRYEPSDGGVLFRAGFTPIFGPGGFIPWAGLSVGYSF